VYNSSKHNSNTILLYRATAGWWYPF